MGLTSRVNGVYKWCQQWGSPVTEVVVAHIGYAKVKRSVEPLVSRKVPPAMRAQHASALIHEYAPLLNWLMAERDAAVIEAIDSGTTGTELGATTGLTRSMISKIYAKKDQGMLGGDAPLDSMAQVRSTIGHFTRPIRRTY